MSLNQIQTGAKASSSAANRTIERVATSVNYASSPAYSLSSYDDDSDDDSNHSGPGSRVGSFTERITTKPSETGDQFISLKKLKSNTVGRFSYQLDRYKKNSMLIFHMFSYEGSYETVDSVQEAFQRFRFEAEVYHDISGDNVRTVCKEFFARDFSDVGAVAVVVVASATSSDQYRCPEGTFSNDDILRYYRTDVPPSLKLKPKLFISQAYNRVVYQSHERYVNDGSATASSSTTDVSSHVYEIYLPATIYIDPPLSKIIYGDRMCHPLDLISWKLELVGDQRSFQEMIEDEVTRLENTYPFINPNSRVRFHGEIFNDMRSLILWRS